MKRILLLLVACAACSASGALAQETDAGSLDVLELRNGQDMTGRVVAEDEDSITFEVRGSEIVLPRRLVAKIVRGERRDVEAAANAADAASMRRFEDRDAYYFVYYRGRRVGWRERVLRRRADDVHGYHFEARTVFRKQDGGDDVDLRVIEFVDDELKPRNVSVHERSADWAELRTGLVDKGHMRLKRGNDVGTEILFSNDTEFLMPLLRRLAQATHFPDKGEEFKIFDPVEQRFVRMHARRELRKEVVANKHQFVTVWRFESGAKAWEVWLDGYGGIVREELGSAHMVAVRAPKEQVLAYAEGHEVEGDEDLSLQYENEPAGFRLVRPNLTWSFDFPDGRSAVAITLLNPALQASVDVVALEQTEEGVEPETLLLDLIERMRSRSASAEVLFQKEATVAGRNGLRFEMKGTRKGVEVHTLGAICQAGKRCYALLLAAPTYRWHEAQPQLERVLQSFEVLAEPTHLPAALEMN